MSKKPGKKMNGGKGAMTAAEHRKIANTLQAKARIHHAKADLHEAMNPPKSKNPRDCY